MLLYFGYGLWNSRENIRDFSTKFGEKHISFEDPPDSLDVRYHMEIIPAHQSTKLDSADEQMKDYSTEDIHP